MLQLLLMSVVYYFHNLFSGMQEYIEAVALWHFMAKRNIITLEDIQKRLTFKQVSLLYAY